MRGASRFFGLVRTHARRSVWHSAFEDAADAKALAVEIARLRALNGTRSSYASTIDEDRARLAGLLSEYEALTGEPLDDEAPAATSRE